MLWHYIAVVNTVPNLVVTKFCDAYISHPKNLCGKVY
jgi:hypothetical protein